MIRADAVVRGKPLVFEIGHREFSFLRLSGIAVGEGCSFARLELF